MTLSEPTVQDARTGYVDLEGDRIVFDVRGTGEPLILLPGTPGDASAYSLVAPQMATDYTVVTYDPRGFGRSTGREPRRYEIGQQARDVVGVLNAAGIDRALVFGSSAGAEVGLELATNHSEVIARLVTHEPPTIRVLPDSDELQRRIAEIYRTAWTVGSKQAFFGFLLLTGLPFNQGKPFTHAEVDALLPVADTLPNLDFVEFYMKHQMLPLTDYKPDLDAIAQNGVSVVAAAGALSLDLPLGRTARQIADELAVRFATFPGHHGSYSDPDVADAWVKRLREALTAV